MWAMGEGSGPRLPYLKYRQQDGFRPIYRSALTMVIDRAQDDRLTFGYNSIVQSLATLLGIHYISPQGDLPPITFLAFNDASRRALDLWDSRDGPALGVQRPRANSVGSNQARTVLGTANKDVAIDHHILCKGCGVVIDRPIESPHPVIPVVEPAGGHYRGPEPRGTSGLCINPCSESNVSIAKPTCKGYDIRTLYAICAPLP
ncbi:hypothetical protein AG1IA_02437 [Rhizoctonia solani AG-1 IA]|uniref:Uncharacterized protein n=1 Tax=Thanatephorus cucumeris (strain AG1-IA) TaxID=983506 RepID=L8X3D7_THACA|nr:hypothetical protein AG1IA_02437 [Rhizoctonia solani AG-1 IA]